MVLMSKDGERKPTIRDVAKLARVALMTVSRVVNNHPSIRPSTRKKVEAAIQQLGYQQNEAARMLKGQRSKLIGLIVPDLSDQFFAACAHTIQQVARSYGYMTLVISSERDAELEYQQAELMASRRVSGLLIVTSMQAGDERLLKLQSSGLAIVAFDRPLLGIDTDAVLVENRAGAEAAVQHLMDQGHSRIACVGYDERIHTVHERTKGYLNKMHAAGLQPQMTFGLQTLDDVRNWLIQALASKLCPTAVFAVNSRTSIHLLRALGELKVRVPGEMALVGFDDFDLAELVSPPVTTVAQSAVELARRSIHLLMDRIKNTQDGASLSPAKILLPARLIVRSSSGPHQAGKS